MTAADIDLEGLRFTLVFPNVALEKTAALAANVQSLGPIQPLSLLYPAAIAEQAGAEVSVIDASALGLDLAATVRHVQAHRPEVVGFTLATLDLAFSIEWITAIRRAVDVPVVVGGIQVGEFPLETLTHECIDWGIVGDAEETLPQLLDAWRRGKAVRHVAGVAYRRKDGTPRLSRTRRTWDDVDATPWPARHLVPVEKYWSIVSQRDRFTALMTGFGCPFQCVFCVLGGAPFRQRSATSIADEIEHCHRSMGIEEFDFFDPNFAMGKKRVRSICKEFRDRGLADKVIWAARVRPNNIDEALVQDMASAGCVRLCFGLESGDEEILRNADKWQGGLQRMRDAVSWARAAGMETLGFFVLGNPGETKESLERSKRFILSLDLDFIQVAPIFMLPGSPLYKRYVEQTGDDFWRRHSVDLQPLTQLPYLDTELTGPELKAAAMDIYRSFYFRPRQVWRGLKRMRRPKELRRAWNAAKGLLNRQEPVLADC
jgi:anaerobic magnesium-protoporphyrin IX monomethyl ester cyclase